MAPVDINLTEHTVQADVGLCLILVANVMNIIAFVSHTWAVPHGKEDQYGSFGYGLWQYCDSNKDMTKHGCGSLADGNQPAWLKASQAMMVLGFVCMVLAMFTMVAYICIRAFNQKKPVVILFSILCVPAAIFCLIGTIVYGTHASRYATEEGFKYAKLAWGFVLANVAIFAVLCGGALGLVELKMNPKLDVKEEPMMALENPVATIDMLDVPTTISPSALKY